KGLPGPTLPRRELGREGGGGGSRTALSRCDLQRAAGYRLGGCPSWLTGLPYPSGPLGFTSSPAIGPASRTHLRRRARLERNSYLERPFARHNPPPTGQRVGDATVSVDLERPPGAAHFEEADQPC